MIEQILLGITQGITEWLPISSSGILILIQKQFLNHSPSLEDLSRYSLFLHCGTYFAAFIYFYKDIKNIFKSLFNYSTSTIAHKRIIIFLLISTTISGLIGVVLIKILSNFENHFSQSTPYILTLVGTLLLVTGLFDLMKKSSGFKSIENLSIKDGIILGIIQGLSALPGLSRSGLTVAMLLLRQFNKTDALRISFLMSIPIVFIGNIVLGLDNFSLSKNMFIGLLFSFLFGLASIHILLKISQNIRFGYFVILFGLLTLISQFF